MPKKYKDLEKHEQKALDEAFGGFEKKITTSDALSFVAGWLACRRYLKKLAENSPPPGIYRGEFRIEDL